MPDQQSAIRTAAAEAFGAGVVGHDLLVCPDRDAVGRLFGRGIRMLTSLQVPIGRTQGGVVVEAPGDTPPIVVIARATGVQMKRANGASPE